MVVFGRMVWFLPVLLALGPLGLPGQNPAGVRLVADPDTVHVTVGQSVPIAVRAVDAKGRMIDLAVRLGGPRRAVQVRNGEVRGLKAGTYQIVATAVVPGVEPLTLRVPVVVEWPPVAKVTIHGADAPIYRGTVRTLTAVATHADGSRRPGAVVTWTTSDPTRARVDRFGNVTATGTGEVTITAQVEGRRAEARYDVQPLPAGALRIDGGVEQLRTGDVHAFRARVTTADGGALPDAPITWTLAYRPAEGVMAPPAPGQLEEGRFVADVPGIYTVVASVGSLQARTVFEVVPRDGVRRLEVMGTGRQPDLRTTDFWVFTGLDGRDYAITGSKEADGHAYVFDVTDPTHIVKTDSVHVDARAVNDVKVSPDARYATVTREGASNRRNGVVILDLATPAHPTIAATFDQELTGGVHNAFPTENYVFALSGGDKYVIIDVHDIYHPRYVSEYNHPNSRVHDVWVYDGMAYSAEWGTGVVVVDVGNGRWGGTIEHPVFVTSYAVPSGATHAVFPYRSQSSDRFYLFIGDEIMSRAGLAYEGTGRPRGDYARRYDPETGMGGSPLATRGYIQVIDFTDPEDPQMVARYEVSEYGTHNIWVEDDVLYQAYYEGGLRVVDVSGELMGNLYAQGREIAVFKPFDPVGWVANSPMVWSAMPFKGYVFFTDTNSGLWAVKVKPRERPVMDD